MDDDLVRFLRDRHDEEAAAAHKAAALCGCHPPALSWVFGDEETDGRILVADDPHPGVKRKLARRWSGSYEGLFAAEHIVRHDPARVLAEVEAKRELLADYERFVAERRRMMGGWDSYPEPSPVLTAFATVYADHPDYRPEWRP